MKFKLFRIAADGLKSESGITMPVYIGVVTVTSILLFGLAMSTRQQEVAVTRESAQVKSLHVAEAGVNDYLWHINNDYDYYKTTVHPAEGDGWVDKNGGKYHLEITYPTDGQPVLTVKSTGRYKSRLGGWVSTKITAQYRRRTFTQYLYLSNHETQLGTNLLNPWGTGDVINGPAHTNDSFWVDGSPVFGGKLTMVGSLVEMPLSNPTYEEGYEEHAKPVEFPATNEALKLEAKARGYYYYGVTTITLRPDGTVEIANSDTSGRTTGPTGIVALPADGVIYVDGQSYSKGNAANGDVYVKGTLKGELTIASSNNIYITGDLVYSDKSSDILGLIAADSVLINHHKPGLLGLLQDVAPYNIEINAAVFALGKYFAFESWETGLPKGTLTFFGSIAQNYRGFFGTYLPVIHTPLTGYSENFSYDVRMLYDTPPHFIDPLNGGFEQIYWHQSR